jgi:hypothetical protein
MSQTMTNLTLNLATKQAVLSGEMMALYENVNITLLNSGSYSAANLVLGLIHNGVLLASIPQGSFTGSSPSGINGNLNLNTDEMISLFTPAIGRVTIPVSVAIWDMGSSSLLTNDTLYILNNVFNSSMGPPVPVPPFGGGSTQYVALADYNTEIASLPGTFVQRNYPGGNYRISADGLNWEFYDAGLQLWEGWGPVNGVWARLY